MARRLTIQDIAQRANVSYQTVSRVINDKPDVAEGTRRRVQQVIAELDYHPNTSARSLRNQRTKTIGLVVPDSGNPFFAEIAKGIEDAGFEAGYSVILCNSNRMLRRELEYLKLLQSKGVDGIIFITTTANIDQIRPLIEREIPVVMFYRDPGELDIDSFVIDNRQAGYTATRYLLELGHRDIVCIQPASAKTPSGRRVDGYVDALHEWRLSPRNELMLRGDNLLKGGERVTHELLDGGVPFSAIFACNDAMAIGAMRALHSRGHRVAEEVSIVGIDDIVMASYVNPPLTTVAQPKQIAGKQAVQFLLQRMEQKYNDGPRTTVLETKLIIRSSSRAIELD